MRIFTKILKYVLSFLLAVSLIATVVVTIVSSTILKKDYVIGKFKETHYYENIYTEINNNFENYINQSGLDAIVLDGIVTEEKVQKDVNIILGNIYDGTEIVLDTTEIETALSTNITNSLEGRKLNASQQEAINDFIKTICDEYKETMTHTNYEKDINNVYKQIMKYLDLVQRGSIIAVAVLVLILLVLNIKNVQRWLSYVGVSLLGSGLFYLIVNYIVTTMIKIDTITILNNSISVVLRNILNSMVSSIYTYAIGFTAGGVILIIVGNIINSAIYENRRRAANITRGAE